MKKLVAVILSDASKSKSTPERRIPQELRLILVLSAINNGAITGTSLDSSRESQTHPSLWYSPEITNKNSSKNKNSQTSNVFKHCSANCLTDSISLVSSN